MRMQLAEFLAKYLVSKGIRTNFTITGGGAMYLNAAFGHVDGMNNVYVQHEQAAAIAAEAYYRMNNELPLVCCTTGPGGTNTLTGVLGAWLDSIPMLVISGQVKYSATVRSTGYPMRIYGDQEFDIVNVVKPMTKYAEMVIHPEMIQYHIDKALWLACNGRPGPVWLDIPQNVQNAEIDTNDLIQFDSAQMKNRQPMDTTKKTLELILEKLKCAERPVIYAGAEIRTSGAFADFMQLIEKLNVPVVTSFDSIDLLPEDHRLYAGRAGDVGNRFGNWAVQNSDFLLVLGNRLGIRQVSYAVETWARNAFVVMVHEDPLELTKPVVHVELPVRARTRRFISQLLDCVTSCLPEKKKWLEQCEEWKLKYPVLDKERHCKKEGRANPYYFMDRLGEFIPEGVPVVSTNGSACVVASSALKINKNQRYIINCGCASMGYDLPAAEGVCFANELGMVVCLAGDGSIQMNIQELQTIIHHNLPIKIFVLNNSGYHSIRQTQENLFSDLCKVGIGPESGDLSFPKMKKIAEAYGFPYYSIANNLEIEEVLKEVFASDGKCICEIFIDEKQGFEPKPTAKKLEDGTLVSPPLEDLAPFLPREELEKIMLIPLVEK
ncbi:acetolactate synthase-1/2/3 large subunit [Lachnospiraceae bacterium XBB1006]|nr:acetolactate synthase-1/2/3 large subunit [Lachnospiraceae bacterium XBB1006]